MAIKLVGIFHIIEWIRATILLTVVCLGVNLMKVWYISAVSTIYGLVAFIYRHAAYWSEEATACAEGQPTRHQWMMVEIIFFWILFGLYQFPMLLLRLFKREKLNEFLNEDSE